MKTYQQTFPIRIHDVDAAGIVFFARYYVLVHDVYEAFMADIGHSIPDAINAGDYIIPIKNSRADYRRPMRHGESITAELFLTELRGSSFVVQTTLTGPDNELRATVTTCHVCVHLASMKPARLPASLHTALAAYLHESA